MWISSGNNAKILIFFAIFARLCARSLGVGAKVMINNCLRIYIWNFQQSMILP